MSISRGRRDRQRLKYNLLAILAGFICLLFMSSVRCLVASQLAANAWRRAGQAAPVFLLGESQAQRNWPATVRGVKESDGRSRHAARWLVSHIPSVCLIRLLFLQLFLAGRRRVGNEKECL